MICMFCADCCRSAGVVSNRPVGAAFLGTSHLMSISNAVQYDMVDSKKNVTEGRTPPRCAAEMTE